MEAVPLPLISSGDSGRLGATVQCHNRDNCYPCYHPSSYHQCHHSIVMYHIQVFHIIKLLIFS